MSLPNTPFNLSGVLCTVENTIYAATSPQLADQQLMDGAKKRRDSCPNIPS